MEKPMQNTYICIQSWMITELDLKGNDLMIYAIIYGFCQDGESRYKGGRSYLAKWTNSTVRGVQKNLNHLIEKGYLAKEEKRVNGTKVCDYYPVNLPWEKNGEADGGEQSSPGVGNKVPSGGEQSSLGVGNKVPLGREQSSPHNIKSNIKDNIKGTSSSETPPGSVGRKSSETEQVVEAWNRLGEFGIKMISRIDPGSERYKMLHARIRQYGLLSVLKAIENIKCSSFLQGSGKKGWTVTFDWFVRPNNFPKVLEGNYEDADGKGTETKADGSGHSGGVENADRELDEWNEMFRKSREKYRRSRQEGQEHLSDLQK